MNAQVAAALAGQLLLRIEDLDRTRSKPQFEVGILEDLSWLEVRFEPAVRRQSEHPEDYARALLRLDAMGLIYPCFCSRSEVALGAAGRDPDGGLLYAGACRALSSEARAARFARGDKAAWRLDIEAATRHVAGQLGWTEYGEGVTPEEREAAPQLWGDVVLKGRDLAASYHLAVTVDDALQGVTDVVRGRDLLASTSVHRLLQTLLGFPAPRYRHHRLVLDATGAKLSKSRLSPSLADLRARGLRAGEIRAALGFGGVTSRLAVTIS